MLVNRKEQEDSLSLCSMDKNDHKILETNKKKRHSRNCRHCMSHPLILLNKNYIAIIIYYLNYLHRYMSMTHVRKIKAQQCNISSYEQQNKQNCQQFPRKEHFYISLKLGTIFIKCVSGCRGTAREYFSGPELTMGCSWRLTVTITKRNIPKM